MQGPYQTSKDVTRSESSEDPGSNVVDAENSQPSPLAQAVVLEQSDVVGVDPEPGQPSDIQGSESKRVPNVLVPVPVPPTVSSPPDIIPQHVQVVRRRRPLRPILSEEPDQSHQFPPTPLPTFRQDVTPSTPPNLLGMLHTSYMYLIFCLPYHYRGDTSAQQRGASDISHLREGDSLSSFYLGWQSFKTRSMNEWSHAEKVAGILFA